MIKKITLKETKELVKIAKKYNNMQGIHFTSIIFFISNNTLYKEIRTLENNLSDEFSSRDYKSYIEMEQEFIFDCEHTMSDNIRDLQLNINNFVEAYNTEKSLVEGLRNQIESLEDGGVINLVSFIENEGLEVNDIALMELYNGIKDMNIRTGKTINNIPQSIIVFGGC